MTRPITIPMLVDDFCETLPAMRREMAFVSYLSGGVIEVYTMDGSMIEYDGLQHDILSYNFDWGFDTHYMKKYDERRFPMDEQGYREMIADLLQGRLYAMRCTQRSLALKLGFSEHAIHRYLHAMRTPSAYFVYVANKNLRISENDPWRLP